MPADAGRATIRKEYGSNVFAGRRICCAAGIAALGLAGISWARRAPIRGFRDLSAAAGIRFAYDNDASGAHRFVETTGGGCAWLDFDNDGFLDIFAVQGGPAPGSTARPRPPHALYRNLGNGRFRDATGPAGLAGDSGYGQGVAAADYDGDGWTDLLLTTYGGVRLFRNQGGRFRDVTRQAGLAAAPGGPERAPWTTSAAWADFDRDGHLDLFVCHYVWWEPGRDQPCGDGQGRPAYCSPVEYVGTPSALYRGDGGGFEDVTKRAGLHQVEGKALGAAWADFDGDGLPDLFVANDLAANFLFRNQGNGCFRETGTAAGCALGPTGTALSGMGVAVGDLDGDRREDIFVTNFSRQPRSYYLNGATGLFSWAGHRVEGNATDQPLLGFGVESLDFNLDGRLDLVIGNGHINRLAEAFAGGVTFRQRQQLLRNAGDGRFVDDRRLAGDLNHPRITRGLAVADYDNDGRPDCLVSGPGSPLALFRNELRDVGSWVGFRLEGTKSNRDGIGCRVEVTAGGSVQARTARSGSSYCSRSDARLLFGLGRAERIDGLRVSWPSGTEEQLPGPRPGRYYLLKEGAGCRPDPPRPGTGES